MKILLTGSSGQIGWELRRSLQGLGSIIAPDHGTLDFATPQVIEPYVTQIAPDLIVNAAGYTAVDQAEAEPELAHLVNGEAPGALARAARKTGALLIHYSTDYVFDGTARRPYRHDDPTGPINVYGLSKLAGEQAIAESGADALVLRTSWVYSSRRKNFMLAILRKAAGGQGLRVVDDQHGCPTPARLIAQITARVIGASGASGGSGFGDDAGVHHLACAGVTTWHEFAGAICEVADVRPLPTITAVDSGEYPTPAPRPRYSALCCRELEERFGVRLPPWREALSRMLREDLPALAATNERPTGEGDP